MFVLLSPAKRLVEPPAVAELPFTLPDLLDESVQLAAVARELGVDGLAHLMDLSEDLAELNAARFRAFSVPYGPDRARQAALSFAGDAYLGLDAPSLSVEDLQWAQRHLGILSGLYGLLRPLDLILPYRLEMGSALATSRGGNLVAFWRGRLTRAVAARVRDAGGGTVLNLASSEYSRAVDLGALGARVITPTFQDVKDGKARSYMAYAKRARGEMARWVIVNRVTDPESLRGCDVGGYRFDAEAASGGRDWVFSRPHPAGA